MVFVSDGMPFVWIRAFVVQVFAMATVGPVKLGNLVNFDAIDKTSWVSVWILRG